MVLRFFFDNNISPAMVGKLVALLLGVLTALVCVIRTTHTRTPNTVDWYTTTQSVSVEGVVSTEPDKRPMKTLYTIAVDQFIDGSGTLIKGLQGNVLATDRRQWPEYQFGDRVAVFGVLEKPEQIEEFHYEHYLSRYDIYSVMYRGSFQIKTNNRQPTTSTELRRTLYSLKKSFESQINRLYPEPHASFMAGLLTGSRRGIPEDLLEAFAATGLTHIIAISGYNITIVIAIISSLLFWLPLKVRFFPATIAIVCFTIFVGASAAVVRAAIMGILGLLALQNGRTTTVRLSILWTAFFMIAWNPKVLWYDAGFQLSFLAVIGLTELGTLLEKVFQRVPKTLAIRESLQMTVAAQIAAVPLIIILFKRFSLIAPIANLLIAPAIPLAMLFGAVGTLLSFGLFPLGQLVSYLGWSCLEWIIIVAYICNAIPFASIQIDIPTWTLIPYYGFIIYVLQRKTHD
ncbi:MAG: ComEC/Rec2 family competence protein [bacterium]|nr:ComEC/Rec2 family competence protein [bacterium]